MSCENHTSGDGGDNLEGHPGNRPFDMSATAWMLGQAVRYLNTADKDGELAYRRVIEVLRQSGKDLVDTVARMFRQAKAGDSPLRWSLLYVLGDTGNQDAADFLMRTALQPLPEAQPDQCEGSRDIEMLVATMAIYALGEVAKRHADAGEAVLKIVSARPARALLIEAVKVGAYLGLRERVAALLPQEDRWILDIRQARQGEVFADPEREDGKERGFTPPKTGDLQTAPRVACCATKEN